MFIDLKVRKNKLAWKHESIHSGKEFHAFMCSVEDKLACENKLPSFYKR